MRLGDLLLTSREKSAADQLTALKLRQYERIVSGRQFTEPSRLRAPLPVLPAPRIPREPTL